MRFEIRDFRRALIDDLTAEFSRFGAQVDEVVRGVHYGLLVLDDDEGVPLVAEAVHDADEAIDVARVETDGGFVEHEQRSC